VRCAFIDYQMVRIGSPALDLNCLFYTALNYHDLANNIPRFLRHYYTEVGEILRRAGFQMPYSLIELKYEVEAKSIHGLKMGVDKLMRNQCLTPNTVHDYGEQYRTILLSEEDRYLYEGIVPDEGLIKLFQVFFTEKLLKYKMPLAYIKSLISSNDQLRSLLD